MTRVLAENVQTGPARELRVLTWNVDGLNESQLGQRTERLCLEMLVGGDLARAAAGAPMPPMPHVLALQEVVRVAHRAYLAPHLAAAGFTLWPPAPLEEREHYELIAVRPPWRLERCERRPLSDSPLARECTLATLRHDAPGDVPGDAPGGGAASAAPVTVMTAHMESLRSGSGSRLAQAREIAAWMRAADGPAIFAGDTNLRDTEWESLEGALGVRDAFLELGAPASARVTWRPEHGGGGFRFDRVWLAGRVTPRSIALRRSPRDSDHAGVEVALSL
jgi:hypothetical protein